MKSEPKKNPRREAEQYVGQKWVTDLIKRTTENPAEMGCYPLSDCSNVVGRPSGIGAGGKRGKGLLIKQLAQQVR